jgi:type IV pilus assembly protein PilM
MARTGAAWGIDIGQCALKALRCRPHESDPDRLVADAFDYIEYPKILSQADAEPDELIGDAIRQFLSRNSVQGDRVAISVGGHSGLVRFIKLPPVEAKKIPEIVNFEARQQIPFDLSDVIWDYQRMGGGAEEEGFALETEIGLFAMKRDVVFRTLEPYQQAGLEVDIVQLAPLALYNFAVYDQLGEVPPPEEYDPDDPPESLVVISLGTDATDLVVTNGYRVWQRSIPIGGNHFTKALTKELKLTFAKAEHLKRNATQAEDPKMVFQAMRPVFTDLVNELQRSIGYFSSIDRHAKIGRVVALGSAIKLPGLRRYLSQSLGFEIEHGESFTKLSGSQVLSAPAFKENSVTYAPCYGLALQALNMGSLKVNLLPGEITRERIIRGKRPWAVAGAAVLLLGCAISYASHTLAVSTVDEKQWGSAMQSAQSVVSTAQTNRSEAETARAAFDSTDEIGQHLIGNVEGRILWLELLHALNQCLPQAEKDDATPPEEVESGLPPAREIAEREELHITSVESQKVDDLGQWFARVYRNGWYQPAEGEQIGAADPAATAAGGQPAGGMGMGGGMGAGGMGGGMGAGGMAGPGMVGPAVPAGMGYGEEMGGGASGGVLPPVEGGPTGPGWVIQLTGYHYHNFTEAQRVQGAQYVRDTLIEKLRNGRIALPRVDADGKELVSMAELGVSFPALLNPGTAQKVIVDLNPAGGEVPSDGRGMMRPRPGRPGQQNGDDGEDNTVELQRFDFTVHFCWKPVTPSERHQRRLEAEQRAAAEAQAGGQPPMQPAPNVPPSGPPSGLPAGPPAGI